MFRINETQRDLIRKQNEEDKRSLELSQINVRAESPSKQTKVKTADGFRKTQRDFIREDIEEDRRMERIHEDQRKIQQQWSQLEVEEKPVDSDNGTVRKSKIPLWPKIIALVIGIGILVGGVVALIWFVKGDKDRAEPGGVLENRKPAAYCSDLSFGLGQILEFECNIKPNGTVTAEFVEKLVYPEDTPKFECKGTRDGNTICAFDEPVSCSTKGDIHVSFYDNFIPGSQQVIHTEIIKLTIIDYAPKARIKQHISEVDDSSGIFDLTCSVTRTCYLYDLIFEADNYSFGENKTCTTDSSESDGYNIQCNVSVPGDVLYQYIDGRKLYCKPHKDGTEANSVEFVLPLCEDFNSRNTECRNGSSLFDCDVDDDVRETSCQDKCSIIQKCFDVRYYSISDLDDDECPEKCSLTWCRERENNEIDRSAKIPYQELLCSGR